MMCFVIFTLGHIYTGTADGKVLHIYQGEIQVLATLGQPPCGKWEHLY